MRHASQDKVGIYLVTANPLPREALARALRAEIEFDVVGAHAPDVNTERAVLSSGASVVLLDNFDAARSDLTLLRKLMTAAPSLKVILVGMPETERAFLDSIRAGAIGYVLRDASAEVLISSVRAILNGEAVCPAQMIFSAYKYIPGGGIATPSFTSENKHAAYVAIAEPRALHFFAHTS
jgi:DNA-binding NarL/FixJ family response regulator